MLAAIDWSQVVVTVATAVGLSGLLSVVLDAYFTRRQRQDELRDVWRRDRLTTVVMEFIPAGRSLLGHSKLLYLAYRAATETASPEDRKDYVELDREWSEKLSELRRLEIPTLLFIGEAHRAAIAAYTNHLEGLWTAARESSAAFDAAQEKAESLHVSMVAAVRADFGIT